MLIHTEIRFIKKQFEDGFGFTCMKAAYSFGITGKMEYGQDLMVVIHSEGEESGMAQFIQWLESDAKDPDEVIYAKSMDYSGKYTEFDIYFRDNRSGSKIKETNPII
jgi:acylphosphatase